MNMAFGLRQAIRGTAQATIGSLILTLALLAPASVSADAVDDARAAIDDAAGLIDAFPPNELRPPWRNELLAGLDWMDVQIAGGEVCPASDQLLGMMAAIQPWRDRILVPIDAAGDHPIGIAPQLRRLEVLDAIGETLLRLRLDILGASPPGAACGGGATVGVDESLEPITESLPPLEEDGPPRPLAVMRNARGIITHFVENELWLVADTLEDADAVADRLGAQILRTEIDHGGGPHVLLGISAPDDHVGDLPTHLTALRPGISDAIAVSSAAGRNLLALAAAEAAAGSTIGVNVMGLPDGIREGLTLDARFGPLFAPTPSGWSRNAFNWVHFGAGFVQDIGVPQAWQLLELAGRLESASVPVGIVDQGFLANDMHPDTIYRSTIAGFDGLGSESPIAGWHGLHSAQTAAALVDNSTGAAGTGGPVARAVNVYSSYDFFLAMAGIRTAIDNGAEVVSMSFSGSIPSIFDWTAAPFRLFTGALNGVTLVASAGNDGPRGKDDPGPNEGDVDQQECFIECWESYFVTPCENEGVICVGGIGFNSLNRDEGSSYGTDHKPLWNNDTVDIYAPYCGPVDGESIPDTAITYCGTSHSAPYVAGIFALMHAARPGLATWTLEDNIRFREDSGDEAVHRIIDALGSVHAVMLPVINITDPAPGTVLASGQSVDFQIFRHKAEAGTVAWSSDVDGSLGSGDVLTIDTLSIGNHLITATLGDLSSSIPISVGTIGIVSPDDGQLFIADQDLGSDSPFAEVTLEGLASDGTGTPITGTDLEWSIAVNGGAAELAGTGSPLTVSLHYVDGAPTTHEIILTATDSGGGVQTFSVTVVVDFLF